MTEPKKTTRAYQVNQPRPAGLPEYISAEAWERLRALPTSLCATLFCESQGDGTTAYRVTGEHEGNAHGADIADIVLPDNDSARSHLALYMVAVAEGLAALVPVSPTAPRSRSCLLRRRSEGRDGLPALQG